MRPQHSRRNSDRSRLHRLFLRVVGVLTRSWDPVRGGQLMLLTSGAAVVLTLPLVEPRHWRPMSATTALVTVAALAVSRIIPWHRLHRTATLAFPIFAWAGLSVLGLSTNGIAGTYSGMFVLWFTYIGLSHPSGTSTMLTPLSITAYVMTWGGWSSPLVARLLIAVLVWVVPAELLGALISRQRVLTDEMRLLAHVDTLTNLANRRDLDLRMAEAGPGDTVVLCDLDHFKQLNDTLGHAAGDAVLAEFGLVIRATLRQLDYAARYGGEEFALVLPHTTPVQAIATLNRLRQRWAALRPDITFSTGVAPCRSGQASAGALHEADQALYAAKAAGRNRDHTVSGALATEPELRLVG
jgi:diguanylate cyclase (GGDEF)-like protein